MGLDFNVGIMAVASTPEVFPLHIWDEMEQDELESDEVAQMQDNPHLTEDFIPTPQRNYLAQLIQAYLEGHFVNLAKYAASRWSSTAA